MLKDGKERRIGLPVGFPGVDCLRVSDSMVQGLVIQEIKHILDRQRKGGAPIGCAEDGLKEVIHELLQGAFGGEETGQIDLRDHFAAAVSFTVRLAFMVFDLKERRHRDGSAEDGELREGGWDSPDGRIWHGRC